MSDSFEDAFVLSPVSSLGPPLSPWSTERSLIMEMRPSASCAECSMGLEAESLDIYFAQGLRFCSEGCRCMFLSGGSPVGSVVADASMSHGSYEMKNACPCFCGDTSCPHMGGESPPMHRDPEFIVTMVRGSAWRPSTARCCCVLLNKQ
mmetsp:Transcript_34935/g.85914  ORF Transcript_34935/g.85914 Transcript_34935/m.85914 type:complete len:149 (+) Transcript_34935:200-646(+)